MAEHGYPQLTPAQCHAYAMRVQREWHYAHYSKQAQSEILERVKELVERNPRGYLAKIAAEVYR